MDTKRVKLMQIPFFFYTGEKNGSYELAKSASQILPNARFYSLPDLDHGSTSGAVDLIVPKVKEFLAQVS